MSFAFRSLVLVLVALCANSSRASAALDADFFFNRPGFSGFPDTTVENKLVELINEAAPGSTIRMAMYVFERPAVALALNAASHRGVDVRLVLDGSNAARKDQRDNATSIVLHGSGQTPPLFCKNGGCVKFCRGLVRVKIGHRTFGGSCNGLVINHNKFFLFSKLSNGVENVVAQSSENLSDGQMHMYNDLIVIKNDRRLFKGMMQYWGSLYGDHTRLTHFPTADGDGPVRAEFFPRLLGHDPVKAFLDRVSCQLPGSMIRLAEADFTRAGVAKRLRSLAESGCDVKVISRFEPQMFSPSKAVVRNLGHRLMILPYQGLTKSTRSVNSIHTKLILVEASIDGSKEKRPFVLTGSHNLDFFSLRTNDETLLEIRDQRAFDAYLQFWNGMETDARGSGMPLFFAKDESENQLAGAISRHLSEPGFTLIQPTTN